MFVLENSFPGASTLRFDTSGSFLTCSFSYLVSPILQALVSFTRDECFSFFNVTVLIKSRCVPEHPAVDGSDEQGNLEVQSRDISSRLVVWLLFRVRFSGVGRGVDAGELV